MHSMDKTDDLKLTEPNLDLRTFFQCSSWDVTFACKFNYRAIYNNYARLFSWGEAGNNIHNIYLSLTASGTSHGGCIIFGNQQIQVDTNHGTPAHLPNTGYCLLFHY